VNPEIVEVCALTTAEQDTMLKDLLERYLAATGSEKAFALLADWPSAKARFKVLVPPSERSAMGLAEKQAVAA
jgi:glutamate synthase (ferredoxin)